MQLLTPALLIVLIWLLWKLDYYGSILPNTYQVKMATIFMGAVTEGLLYVVSFLAFYLLIVFVPYWLFVGRRIFNMHGMGRVICLLLVWAAYVISIGGDFMEYRLLIPVLPLLMLLVAITLFDIVAGLRVALCCALVVASAWHALNFRGLVSIEPISSLSHHIENPAAAWREVGISLGQTLGGGHSTITIATTAAGAIPYYSQLRTVDMLGLNDSWVARHGDPLVRVNGHRKYAPLRYLIRQGVHLVIGHPSLRRHGQLVERRPESYFWSAINRDELPVGSRVVALPVGDDRVLQMLYIRRHMLIERLIREGTLQAYALE